MRKASAALENKAQGTAKVNIYYISTIILLVSVWEKDCEGRSRAACVVIRYYITVMTQRVYPSKSEFSNVAIPTREYAGPASDGTRSNP
jgi:hypothetical protein